MANVKINKELCKGCGLCVDSCPKNCLALSKTESNNKGYFYVEFVNPNACIGCTSCAIMCPDVVLEVER